MNEYYNSQGQLGILDQGISPNDYDVLKSVVQPRVDDPELLNEYIGAYVMIARNLNLTVAQFADLLREQGSDYNQDVFLAGYLNQNRVSNAKIGVALSLDTPLHIRREIRA